MIADAMGWKLDRVTDDIQPKIAEKRVTSEFLTVEAGQVAGLIQDGVGYRKGEPIIKLHMEAYLGAPESYDAVRIAGKPPLSMKLAGGVHGDIATTSITVNSIPKVLAAAPGLRTMRDVALPSYSGIVDDGYDVSTQVRACAANVRRADGSVLDLSKCTVDEVARPAQQSIDRVRERHERRPDSQLRRGRRRDRADRRDDRRVEQVGGLLLADQRREDLHGRRTGERDGVDLPVEQHAVQPWIDRRVRGLGRGAVRDEIRHAGAASAPGRPPARPAGDRAGR